MAVQIQIRRDSAADWTSNDPTLALGEIGYETDTGKFKIGDGSTAWTALEYNGWWAKTVGIADDNIVEVDGDPNSGEIAVFTANGLAGYTEAELKAAMNLEIGTDVLAQQTIGIADDNLLEVDGSPNDDEWARFTANGIEGLTDAELVTALTENLQDLIGAMFSGNTETGLSIDYQDADGTIDAEVTRAVIHLPLMAADEGVTTGDGKAYFVVPEELNGWNVTSVHAAVIVESSSGTPEFQLYNVTDSVDILSTTTTIDENENTSYTAATAHEVDTDNDDLATGDILRGDIDTAGTGADGAILIITVEKP